MTIPFNFKYKAATLFYRFFSLLRGRVQPVIITGVSGAGKTAVCHKLKSMGFNAINLDDVSDVYKIKNVITGEVFPCPLYLTADSVKQHVTIVEEVALQRLIHDHSRKLTFFCGNLHEADHLYALFHRIILLKISDDVQLYRLQDRPSDFWKDPEAISFVFSFKNRWQEHQIQLGAIVVNADNTLEEVTREILDLSK